MAGLSTPPGLILAAPHSGAGKTTLTLALLRAFARRGLAVAGAKVGPDYIDPGFHRVAAGRSSVNLDPWAMRAASLGTLVAEIAADLVLCEGVMGLFDGAGRAGDKGSTADLATALGWPVVLVIDARGQSASVGALVRGFAGHRADVPLAGVIFNRVGSARHYGMLSAACRAAVPGLAILGWVPRDAGLELPSRHLGLVLAEEHGDIDAFLNRAADTVALHVDLDGLAVLARPARITGGAAAGIPPLGQRVAVARDAAFAFAYPHFLAGWHRAGAEILPFSPLADEGPDGEADAVFLPGGYPELHAGRLAAAECYSTGMRTAAGRGALIYGECGGYMALGEGLTDASGVRHAMLGLLPIATSIANPVRHLGYRQATAIDGPWRGRLFRAHEFHFATETVSGAAPLWRVGDADGTALPPAGMVRGTVMGSFIHLIDARS